MVLTLTIEHLKDNAGGWKVAGFLFFAYSIFASHITGSTGTWLLKRCAK